MSKVDIKRLDSVTKNDTTATEQINDNFQALQTAIENTVSRDGTVPNYMDADLDLNSYRIINAGDPVGERDVVTLKYFEEKTGGAIEAAAEAKASASKAASSAQSALVASNNAIGQLSQAEGLLTAAEQYVDAAKSDINTAVSDAESTISTIVSDAEGSITNIAVTEANKAIANAAQEATDMAKANLNSYVDGTVKPSLQTYVDQAQENANSAATSMEQAALSATAASNYASNASAEANNAANSAGLAANSATAAATSEANAETSETNAAATKAEVETIAKLVSFGNIGDIKYTSRTDVPNGGAWCDGALYTKAQFPDVYQMLVDGKLQSTTISAFDSKVSANGSCGFFGLDTANERFKVPMLKDVYLKAGQAGEMFGAESLPNIKGGDSSNQNSLISPVNSAVGNYGALSIVGNADGSNRTQIGGEAGVLKRAVLNASGSSSTYKDGAKVNPDHVTYRAYVVLYSKVLDVPASVDKALIWAEGTDAQVQALGGEKSAKGWAEASTNVNYTNITNCITEIPQDIKLELNNGALTLKAGSKVYVPNGADNFDVVNVSSDITLTQQWGQNIDCLLFVCGGSILNIMSINRCSSGASDSISGSDHFYYNTANNTLRFIESSGNIRNVPVSLPVAIVKMSGNGANVSSIQQVFNGFGYIGSTMFALPGVKGLIPNGRNEDGTFKNLEFTVSSVLTNTQTNTAGKTWGLYFNADGSHAAFSLGVYKKSIRTLSDRPTTWKGGYCIYVEDENKNYVNQKTVPSIVIMVADIVIGSSSITSFTPKTAFHAVDYNDAVKYSDRETVVGWGVPDYSAGVSKSADTEYTADVNGWIYASGSPKTGQSLTITIDGVQIVFGIQLNVSDSLFIPINRGSKYSITNLSYFTATFYPCKGVN